MADKDQWPTFRQENELTASQFLRAISLEPTSTFVQYLATGAQRRPSSKQGSVGEKLHTALATARSLPLRCLPQVPKEQFLDYVSENDSC
jgi:hypothetical protein